MLSFRMRTEHSTESVSLCWSLAWNVPVANQRQENYIHEKIGISIVIQQRNGIKEGEKEKMVLPCPCELRDKRAW